MKISRLTVAFVLCLMSASAMALSGNEYRRLNPEQRLSWVVGVTDGILIEQLFASGKKPELADCFAKLEWEQVRAIFDKANESQPERWQFPAAFLFRQTFLAYCSKVQNQ